MPSRAPAGSSIRDDPRPRRSHGYIVHSSSSSTPTAASCRPTATRSRRACEAGGFFWLDIHGPDADGLALLRDVFGFHPIALEDSEHFGQRPKLDTYDDYVMLVVYGANARRGRPRRGALLPLRAVPRDRASRRLPGVQRPAHPHHHAPPAHRQRAPSSCTRWSTRWWTASSLCSASSTTASTRSRTASSQAPDDAQLQEIFAIKRTLVSLRKVITPERDLFARIATGVVDDPRHDARRGALLPRRLRPPDPHQRPRRQLPRPARRAPWTSTSPRCRTGSTTS